MTRRIVEPAAERGDRLFGPVDNRQGTLLIGLHGKAEAFEAAQRRIAKHCADNLERQFEPVGFLGVDGETEFVRLRHAGELGDTRRQFRKNALARDRLEARMQRRELDRNTRPCRPGGIPGARADGRNRTGISIEIFLGVIGGARAFAQHVERIAEFAVTACARQGFVDGLAKYEMPADQPHGLPGGGAQGGQAETFDDGVEDGLGRLARMDDARRDPKRPGGSRDQERRGFDVAVEPAAGGELIFDQPVGGSGIGHAQQRLGEDHQSEALLGRERIGVQEILDAAEAAGSGANRLDEAARAGIDAALGCSVEPGADQKPGRQILVGRRERRVEREKPKSSITHRSARISAV